MVREYVPADYKEVSSWFHERNIDISESYLSKNGFIAPGIAAGFIYSTDSSFCIFESFIGNPSVSKEERQAALREIVKKMIEKAKELKFTEAFGFAVSQTMIQIGYEQEFKYVENCTTIVRSL